MSHARTLTLLLAAGGMLLQAQELRHPQEAQEPGHSIRLADAAEDGPGVWPPYTPGGRPITDKAALRR